MLILVGESLKIAEYVINNFTKNQVNGVRLIDKSQIGKKILFRMEIWIRKGYNQNEMEDFKTYLANNFGSIVNESKIN